MVSDFAEPGGRILIVYDGRCGLCNWAVRWLLRRDRLDRLRFAAFESSKVNGMLAQHGIGAPDADWGPSSILVVRDFGAAAELVLARSEAVRALLAELPRPWPAVAGALGWIPLPVRDFAYRLIARWRYRIWGRLESCPLPTAEERGRFL